MQADYLLSEPPVKPGIFLVAVNHINMDLSLYSLNRYEATLFLTFAYFILLSNYYDKELFSPFRKPSLLLRLPEQRGAPWIANSEGKKAVVFLSN